MPDPMFHEMMAATILAAHFVSQPHVWGAFTEWCEENNYLLSGEVMSRELMAESFRVMGQVIREIEIRLLAEKVSQALDGN